MDHRVALAFEDGVTRFITCRDDQTVADASYRARINIPLDCRDGACGTCKSLCESGEFDGGTYLEDALSEDEAASGYALPCSMKPRSDLVLQIPTTSAVAKTSAATHRGSLTPLAALPPRQDERGPPSRLHPRAGPALADDGRPHRRDRRPGRAGLPPRAVRQHRGSRHGGVPLVLLQQRPPGQGADLPREADSGRRHVDLARRARAGR